MITLRDISYNFFYVLFKRKLLFIIASLVVAFSVLLYAYLTTPVHRINSLVLVHQNPKQQLILFRDINTPAQTSQRVHPVYNLKEVVTSRNLSELLVAKYQLDVRARKKMTEPEGLRDIINAYIADVIDLPFLILDFLGILEMGPKDYANKAVEELMYDQIEVGVLAETEVLIINVYDEDPQMALAISKTIIEELANKTVDMEAQKSSQAYLFAKEHVEKEQKKLKDMEDDYLSFKEQQMTVDLEKERKLLL